MLLLRYSLLYFILTICLSSARNAFGGSFIQSFLESEGKPTSVIFSNLCWKKDEIVSFANRLTKLGYRVSSSAKIEHKYQRHDLLYFLDLDCPNAEHEVEKASSRHLFSSPYRWLTVTDSPDDSKWKILSNAPVLPDSDVVLAQKQGEIFILKELHRPSLNHSMIITGRGYFNGTLVDTRPRRELYRRRMNLMGHPLTMANVIQDSNTTRYHLPRENGLEFQNDAVSKICWMNAKLAFLMLNATPQYIFSYRWGYKVNGQWSGMINDLHSGRADIGTNCVVSDTERLSAVTYTDTLAPFRVRFIFRQPPLSYVSNIYALPFSSRVWVATAICAIVSALALCGAAHWETKFGRGPSQMDGGLSDAMLLTMSALSQQGCDMEPKRLPGRIMEMVVFVALMALYAAYSANIVVLLQAPSHSIRTLPQLAASKITLAANDVDYNHFVFQLFKDPVHVAISKRVDPEKGKGKPQFYDIQEGVERIRQGLFAFHSIAEPVYRRIEETFKESEKCDLMEIDYLNSFDPYVPMKKGSPYLELIKVVFKRIRETGIQSALNRRYQVPKPLCVNKSAAFSSVGILDLKAVFIMIGIGAVTAVAILVIEIAVYKLRKKTIGTQNLAEDNLKDSVTSNHNNVKKLANVVF